MSSSPLRPLPTPNITLGSPLGKGTYGEVRKAKDPTTDSPAAAKVFKQNAGRALAEEKAVFTAFRGEPHCLHMRCTAPNVIVSDLIPGKDLHRLWREKQILTFDGVVTVAKQALEFLTGIHKRDYFHGDIKPDNMMLETAARHLTMIDLNGGGKVGEKLSKHVAQGASYKSPEIVLLGQATTALDVWSLGCALFKTITGSELFPGNFIWGRLMNPHLFHRTHHNTPIRDNQHLHMMRDMLGLPSLEFLMTCTERYYRFSQDNGIEFRDPLTPITDAARWKKIEADYKAKQEGKEVQGDDWMLMETCYFKQPNWIEQIRTSLNAQQVPAEKIEQMIALIGSMIRYEGRATAPELLSSPVFENDVHFHLTLPLEFGVKSTDKIAFYRSCDIQIDALPVKPDILIDRAVRVTRHCYHLNKDPDDKYLIVINRGGADILVQPVKIVPGDRVVIEQEEGNLSVEVNKREQVIGALFQAQTEPVQPATPIAVRPTLKQRRENIPTHLAPSQVHVDTQIVDSQPVAAEPSAKKAKVAADYSEELL
jgi:serine/threonine protein kinase